MLLGNSGLALNFQIKIITVINVNFKKKARFELFYCHVLYYVFMSQFTMLLQLIIAKGRHPSITNCTDVTSVTFCSSHHF